MALEKRGEQWSARVRDASGKQHRVSLHTSNEAEARAKYVELKAAMRRGLQVGGAQPNSTLADAFDRAMLMHYKGRKSERTVEFHKAAVFAAVRPSTKLADLGAEHYAAIVRSQREKGNSDTTLNRVFQTLGKVLALAHGWRMMPIAAPTVPRFAEPEGRKRVFTVAEEAAIVAEFQRRGDAYMADLTVFLIDTGFRLGEFVRRDRQAHHAERRAFEVWETKAGTGRTLPLTPRAHAAALRLLAEPTRTKDSIESRWATMRRNIGMEADKQFVIHALRHTCCSRLWRGGMPIAQVMKWMGHHDIKTTMGYTHLIDWRCASCCSTDALPVRAHPWRLLGSR
jgi:integrase